MRTLSPQDLHAQERDEWVAHQDCRQAVASQARALIGQVQTIATGGSKSLQAAWREHIEALADLVCFTECPDFESNSERRRSVSSKQLRSFGALLRARRSAAGLSRVALARRAKISDATVKFVETARHPPSWATLIRLLAVPELKLTWENVPDKLAAAPLAAMALVSDREQPPTEPVGLNCYVAPTLEPVQMVAELGRFLRGSGGLIDPASVYLDHHSAAGYLAVGQQHGATLDHRRRLPLAGVAKLIIGATGGAGLSVVALGSGDAQSEVRLVQHLLEEQPQPEVQLWLVDISQPLLCVGLKHALDTIGSHPGVKVVAVQGNFHHLHTFAILGDVADAARGKPARRCRVYSMLGGTIESVDNELRFAERTIDAKPGDWLVLDVQPAYGSSSDPEMIRRRDPLVKAPLPRVCAEWLGGPIYRHCKDVRSIEFSLGLDTHTGIPGSYGVDAVATVQAGDRADARQFVMFRWKRYDVAQLAQGLAKSGWAHIATLPSGSPASELPVAMVFRKCPAKEATEDSSVQIDLPPAQVSRKLACLQPTPSPTHDTPACTMQKGKRDVHSEQLDRPWRQRKARSSPRTASAALLLAVMLLLALVSSPPAFGQTTPATAPAPRPINPTLGVTGGSCGTLLAPCPAISRLGLFVWLSGQYLGTGLGGNAHASTLGGSVDITMEVANRVAVSASVPGALNRIQGQNGEEVWGIGGPLEARARVRLGPASPGFYSVQARPLWSSVIEVRTQFLIPGFDGDAKYVGRVQRGFVQPAVYGAGELNVWRFQFAPGVGILVGDRQAHADLSLRVSVQLLDRLFGDVEALRRQALAVPNEPGRCQSAWMGAAGVRFQLRRGMFLSARYVGGQGDCVPQHSFMLNLGLAFGEDHMRIPTADEVGFIRKWHAILMGMVDPVLDCQGIMRADDGTPMFRFGYPDAHNPSVIWRNHVAYRVGEHFWEKGGNLYRDTDLLHPVLDLYGEAPLTFAERAAIHDCPSLPGLGSPCQVALNLPALRQRLERGDRPVYVALTEDAQILACLNHLSPLKAAAVFTSIQAALGPLLARLPQVARWPNPAAAPTSPPDAPGAAATAPTRTHPAQPGGPSKVAASTPPAHGGQQSRPTEQQNLPQKPGAPGTGSGLPLPPSLSRWQGRGASRAAVDQISPPGSPDAGPIHSRPSAAERTSPNKPPGQTMPAPTVARNAAPTGDANTTPPRHHQQESRTPAATSDVRESVAAAPLPGAERGSQEPAPSAPLCGTKCMLTLGGFGMLAAGAVGGEVVKDGVILGAAESIANIAMGIAGATGGALTTKIVVDGVADHATPPSAPADPSPSASSEKPASSVGESAGEESNQSPAREPHRNRADDRPATLYEKYDKNGNFEKHGVTHHENPAKRYTKKEIDQGRVEGVDRGPRKKMLEKERELVETNPGPKNREPWAGKRKTTNRTE